LEAIGFRCAYAMTSNSRVSLKTEVLLAALSYCGLRLIPLLAVTSPNSEKNINAH
jgi:hypothetical protein